jgi:hypothetical protein
MINGDGRVRSHPNIGARPRKLRKPGLQRANGLPIYDRVTWHSLAPLVIGQHQHRPAGGKDMPKPVRGLDWLWVPGATQCDAEGGGN